MKLVRLQRSVVKDYYSIMSFLRLSYYTKLDTDFRTLLEDTTEGMTVLGLNIRKPSFKTWSSNLRFYFIALVYVVEIFGNIRAIFLNDIDVKQLIINICHLFGVFMTTIRYLHLFYDADTFNGLIDTVIKNTKNFNLDVEFEEKLAKRYARISRLIQLSLYIIFRLVVFTNAGIPIVFIKWYMMCPINIPGLDIRSHFGYEIAQFYYLFFYYYFLSALHFYDSYFFFFSMYIVMKSNLFCSLASNIGDFESKFNNAAKQKKLLSDLCVLHQEITTFTNIFAKNSAILVFGTGLVSLVCLPVAMFIRNVDPLYCFTLISITTTQFFLLCFFGEMLLRESDKMSSVIYSSTWYNLDDTKDLETIAFLIQHSQRRIKFSAYGMYDLSMETFSGFLQRAYSYYAFLSSI